MDSLSSQLQRKRPFKRRASDFDLEQVREHASSGIREFLTDPAPQLDPLSILGRKQMGEKPAPDTSGERVLPFPAAERTASQRLPSAPELGAPKLDAPEVRAAEVTAPYVGAPELGAPELNAPGFSDPAWGEIDLESPEFRPPRRQPVPKEAHTAQDGHTRGEQTVYSTLWALGRPVARHAKVVVCGDRTIADRAGLAYSNCRANLFSLEEKLAIQMRKPSGPGRPKAIIVFSYEEILRRRRAAGLTHVLRKTSGVRLINPATPAPELGAAIVGAPELSAPVLGAPDLNLDAPNSGAPELTSGALNLGAPDLSSGAPNLGAPIRNREIWFRKTPPAEVTAALRKIFGECEDSYATYIAEGCRRAAPDASIPEILHFIEVHAQAANRGENPKGLLATKVIASFTGEGFRQYRKETAYQRWVDTQRDRETARAILDDPESLPEETIAWAKEILGEGNERE